MKKYLLFISAFILLLCSLAFTGCDNSAESTCQHDWKSATCTTPKTCSKCNETMGNAYGHTWIGNESCTVSKVCSRCNEPQNKNPGHIEGEWIVDAEATCIADGSKHQVCSVCNESIKTETIPATGHTEGEWIVNAEATCIADGSKHQVCSVCNESIKTETIPATGHTWSEKKCGEAIYCLTCNTTDGEPIKHSFSGNECSICGMGFGQVKGTITWKYNKVLGTRGDDGAKVMLIPIGKNTKDFDNNLAAMLISGEYDSGIIVAECDGYGNYDFGNNVLEGEYICLIVSENTTEESRFKNEGSWKSLIEIYFGDYFSTEDLETLMVFIGYNSYSYKVVDVEKGRTKTVSHDFGYTYI